MVSEMRQLGALERDRVWRSSRSGALYRWRDSFWEFQHADGGGWYPVAAVSDSRSQVVRSFPLERFVEVPAT